MKTPTMPSRWLVAVAMVGLVTVASYATQRLLDARTEPEIGAVIAQTFIPYYWRVGASVLHGLMAGVLVGMGLPESRADRALEGLPVVAVPVVLAAAVAMLVVP